ncbi:MAG: DUF4340 domain-containing protein [Myxococcales bacterium]|nr:DUF4340 domain-containing protein [Myxococcales bacterium]
MEWQRYRLVIISFIAVALIGATWWAVTSQTGDTPVDENEEQALALPEVERENVTELEIHIPAGEGEDQPAETVRLVRGDEDHWRLAEPVEADAATTAITTALDKISSLEVVGRAASNATHHEQLEVDAAHGVRVIARNGAETLVDLWIGAYRSGNTMVRQEGQDTVLMVRGSIKFAFNKRTRDWRNRAILELTAADVNEIEYTNENGHWTFHKTEDTWAEVLPEPAEGEEPPTPIEGFDQARVRTAVSSLARLRAADFGTGSAEEAGLGEGAATVRMVTGEGDDAQTVLLRVGSEGEDGQRYVQRDGDETIYLVSRFMADRLIPNVEAFQPGEEPAEPPSHGGMPGGMPGMPGMPGGPGGGQIPPEIMQQIQQQLQQQGAAGH